MKLLAAFTPELKPLPGNPLQPYLDEPDMIAVLRHGRIHMPDAGGSGSRRYIGRTDLPLSDSGRGPARAWQPLLAGFRFKAVYASELVRCRETARLAFPGIPPVIDPRINEIHMGGWENRSFDRIREKYPDEFDRRGRHMDSFRPPGGESFQDVHDRIVPFFQGLKTHHQEPVLVVTHAGVIRTLLCHISDKPLSRVFDFRPDYGELFLISK